MDNSDEGRTLHEIAMKMQDSIAHDASMERAKRIAELHSDADFLEDHIERLKDKHAKLLRQISELERA
jgi:cell division protein FtsB